MQKYKKKCDASIRVLETLKLLSKQEASSLELIKYLEKVNPQNGVYTNEAIAKYINTLKVYGFKFVKSKDKFVLLNALPQFKLNEQELSGLKHMEILANGFPEESIKNEINNFLQELERRFSEETIIFSQNIKNRNRTEINYSKYKNIINKLEKYCQEKLRLKLTYKTDKGIISIVAEPHEINYINHKIYFSIYNPILGEIQDIQVENIVKTQQLPTKTNPNKMLSSVTFELKDRLANAYKLKENERLLNTRENGNIVIINQSEDTNMLLNRLLRYGENCEILTPKTFRAEMHNKIKTALAQYIKQ